MGGPDLFKQEMDNETLVCLFMARIKFAPDEVVKLQTERSPFIDSCMNLLSFISSARRPSFDANLSSTSWAVLFLQESLL